MEHKTLSVRIPTQKHAQLVKLAAEYGVSLAVIVRWAISAYIESQEATDGE